MKTMGYVYDNCSKDLKEALYPILCEIFYLIGFVLPCIYCRVSYQFFTDPKMKHSSTNIERFLKEGKALQWVINVEKRVTQKLHLQGKKHSRLLEHRDPPFETRFNEKYWHATLLFLNYMMCDDSTEFELRMWMLFSIGLFMQTLERHDPSLPRFSHAFLFSQHQPMDILWSINYKVSVIGNFAMIRPVCEAS